MIKKVTLIKGCGKYSRKWGYSAHERYLIQKAKITEASPCYYLIEGEAEVYQGKKSERFLRKEIFKETIKKNAYGLLLEDLANSINYTLED
jgi:hypothetical protein